MSVGIDFFAAAIQAIAKVHGNRAVLQSQWDALVAAAGEFERVYKECAPVPDDDDTPRLIYADWLQEHGDRQPWEGE